MHTLALSLTLDETILASGITLTLNMSELQTGHSNQSVKLNYLCIALMTAWMGADSAAALMDAVQW